MEQRGATSGKGSTRRRPENGLNYRQTVATAATCRRLDRMVNRRSCRWLPPVARGPLSEKEEVDSGVPASSDERNVVGAADCPAFDDVGVDADIRLIVLSCGTQDAGILG